MTLLSRERYVAWSLGLAGLIPFIGCALLALTAPVSWQVTAINGFVYYSAVILSFLGGVHWGSALQVPRPDNVWRLVLAMLPSLIAWPALLFNIELGLWMLLVGFVLVGGFDISRVGQQGFPKWYVMLRILLSFVVVALHSIVLLRLSGEG